MKNRLCLQVTTYLPSPTPKIKIYYSCPNSCSVYWRNYSYITSRTGSNSDTDTETEWLSATDTVTNSEPDNASSVTVHAGTSAENINPNSHVKENAATGNVERPAQQNTETANLSAMSANMPPKKKKRLR